MPPKPGSSVGTGRQRSHVSIFDRRGQKPGRSRAQTGKNAGNTTSFNQGTGHRGNQGGHGDDAGAHGSTSLLFNKVCMLRFHEDTFSTSDLVVNASFFPGVRVGDIVSIKPLADGDEGDLTSPRGSFDNSDGMGATSANAAATASSAAAAAAAGAGATGMTSASAASGGAGSAAAAVPTAGGKAETSLATSSTHNADGAGAGSGAGTANGKPSSVRGMGADFKDPSSATRMADLAYRGSRRDFDDKYRLSAGIGGGGVPRSPNRWGGGKESERTLFSGNIDRTEDDESDVPFKPSPHREILLQVGEVRRDAQQLQASMLTNVARTLWGDYQTNQRVAIRKIDINNPAEREPICADFVEIAFRDQYVGRSDMWRLWRTLSKKIVHANKPTNMEGLIRASVRRIYKNNVQVPCGYIGSSTQAIFRSESGRFIIFIQMSEEMWAYQEDGNLCFEKAVNCFLAELFRRWNEKQLNHMVTIVMFSRWYYHVRDTLYFQDLVYDENAQRYYRDYYKVIADMEVRPDWTVFLPEILSEFNSYRRDIQELVFSAGHRLRGDLSTASQGNILEAINLGINSFASNHVDRDLSRTGLSTIVVTPSFGVFDVDKKLLRMTTERMLHLGLRVDLVCLAPKPLFRPPVFRFWSLPVPSVQEQRRALYRRRLARDNAEKAKATELNSVSPPAESPNSHVNSGGNVTFAVTSGSGISGGGGSGGPGSGGPSAALPKDRGAKAMAVPKPESLVAVDPIMLDPLYFDDENWENELMPYLLGSQPKAAGNASSSREQRLSAWQSGGSSASRLGSGDRLGGAKANEDGASKVCSAVNALLDSMDSAMDNVPDTIKELSLEEYPFFSHGRPAMGIERRVIYCYFPYWMDCGFYNYTDERVSERPDTFRPCCKMGDLSINGASTYLQTKPTIPDIELRAMDAELLSLLGLETNVAPSIESPTLEATHRGRDEEGRSSDAPHVASMPKDSLHGRSVRLASVPEVETLLELFDKFDRRAIVGTGINAGSQPYDMAGVAGTVAGASDAVSQPPHSGMKGLATSVGEYRYASVTTPGILNNSHSSANPSTGNGFWDDFSAPSHTQHYVQQQSLQNRYADSRGGETQDAGLSTSAETVDRMTATVSTSVSPNITRGQSVKPPARSDHNPAFSASVPYEVKLNTSRPGANATNGASVHGNAQATGHTQTQAQAPIAVGAHQRTSVFMRNSSQRKRMQHQHQHQHQQYQQYQQQAPNHAGRADLAEASEPAETYSGQGQPRQEGYRAGSHSGPSPEMTVSMAAAAVSAAASAGSAKWRGAAPEYSVRPNMSRVSESPQSVHCEHIIHGSQERGTSDIMIAPNPPGERVGVSESMAKQSHLDDHIRTFKGTHGSQDATHQSQPYHHLQHQKQLQQTTAALIHPTSAAQRHSTMGGALLTGSDFQLTLPANRQSAGLFGHNSASISTGFRSIPSQPMAPVEYKGGSPQYCRTIWLSDRHSIVTHAPDQALRGPRGRTYSSYNPCNPELYPLPHTELSQRWALAFPTFWLLSSFTPKWRSLCTPASLPLVTDYSPTDLGNFYRRYNYDVKTPDIDMEYSVDMAAEDYDEFSQFMAIRTPSSAPVAAPIGVATAAPLAAGNEHHPAPPLLPIDRSTRVMLKEMVYQRLAQGFQFINYGDSVNFMKGMRDVTSRIGSRGARLKMGNGRPGDPDRPGTRSGTDPYSGADAQHSGLLPGAGMSHKMGKTVWLSNGRQIQRLELQESNDPSHMPGVVVTRWERNKHFDQSDFRYRFQMWSRNNNMGYCPANIRFAYPRSEE
ncbi:vacuolar membrane-associated protein iml1, partial [Coemansia sp. RSA 2599]